MFKSNVCKVFLFLMFVPAIVVPMLENSMENIDKLIKQGKYQSASREIMTEILDERFSKSKQEYALEFAIDKVKHLANLDRAVATKEGDTESCIEFALKDLTKAVIGYLSRKKSLADAAYFINDFLAGFFHKWVDVSVSMIEELFYRSDMPSLDLLAVYVDHFLLPRDDQDFDIFVKCVQDYVLPVRNIFGSFLNPGNMAIFQESGDHGLRAIEIGKKYVDYFFVHGQEAIRKQVLNNCKDFTVTTYKDGKKEVSHDNAGEDLIEAFSECGAGAAASLALSTALFMKKEDAVVYIREVYDQLIEYGYLAVAKDLKIYCTDQSFEDDAEAHYLIRNPKNALSKKLVIIPEHLAKAFN